MIAVSANVSGAVIFTGTMLTVTALVLSRRAERWAAGMQRGVWRRQDAARRASARYLARHPHIAAFLNDERPDEELEDVA